MPLSFKLQRFTASRELLLLNLFSIFGVGIGMGTSSSWKRSESCRFLPGDQGWPSPQEWGELNKTIGGRLIAAVPLAAVCHTPGLLNETECAILAANWSAPQTHFGSPSSIMAPYWQNQSCDPFTPESTPCRLGNYADFSVNVSSASDVVAGLKFAEEKNIRLVIKNTGHDYLGKSTGRAALGLWTHNLNSIDFLNYSSKGYTGPAIKMGAGVVAYQAYEAASARGLRVIGGECTTVGLAGGYTQGGGHSALSSTYGMGADQTLEWEVVTANGTHLIATPTQNQDLYFALSGGGGGTYGVVLSMTVKAHPDGIMGGATVAFERTTDAQYWEAIEFVHTSLPAIVDTGATVSYLLTNTTFLLGGITAPNRTVAEVNLLLEPILSKLKSMNISTFLSTTSLPTYIDHFDLYFGALPFGKPLIDDVDIFIGSRLIPRSVVQDTISNSAFSGALKTALANGVSVSGLALSASHAVAGNEPGSNALLPAWRDAILHSIFNGEWNFTAPMAVNQATVDIIIDTIVPAFEAVAPDSGAYMNEDVFEQTNFQQTFFGSNYETLRAIKKAHDPNDLFYAITAVGSEAWAEGSDGRLCRTSDSW